MARNKKNIKITNARGATDTVIIGRKPQKGETIRIGEKIDIQNNGNVGSQTIVNLGTVNGDLYL